MNNTAPFSQRLNNFVEAWFEANKDLFQVYEGTQFNIDNADETFQSFIEHFKATGKVPMWYDDNQDNIFGDTSVNAKFRAWHDYIHVSNSFDFSLEGEQKSFHFQKQYLPQHWKYEIKLLEAEIVGQAEHYTNDKTPIASQRDFALQYIILGSYKDFK